MQLRDIWGARDLFRFEAPETGGGAPPAPGTVETASVSLPDTSAGTQNTATGSEEPGPVPYARFREVNETRKDLEQQLQPLREFEATGYPVEELRRLTMWESEYLQDPVGTWLRTAAEIPELPDGVKAAIDAHVSSGSQGDTRQTDGPPFPPQMDQQSDEPPEWAQRLIAREEQEAEAEREKAISDVYDGLEAAWKALDEKQGIKTPGGAIHSYLAGASPGAASLDEILRNAREQWLIDREELLGSEIQPPGRGPLSVPGGGGGTGTSAPPVRPRTLKEAKSLALAAEERGQLTR